MVPKPGVVKETLSSYKDNIITVMAFFAPTDIYNTMKDTVMDYYINAKKTVYDLGIIFNKLINKNARVVNDKYHQICSTFVDTVLKSGKVTLDKDANVPSPAELYNATKSMPNKIIEVYSGPADKYDSVKEEYRRNIHIFIFFRSKKR
jgi:ethanolamine utilization protein EutA (predicted chaperonin)